MRTFEKDERDLIARILAALEAEGIVLLQDELQDLIEKITKAGGVAALDQVALGAIDESIVHQVNEYAVAYAEERAAELVGKKWVGDVLVDNPNPVWSIDATTRESVRATVEKATSEGWSNDRLADELEAHHAFSEARSQAIARTETAFADVGGNMEAYRTSGQVESKQWLASAGCCDDCQALDGMVVGLDESFPNGGDAGPPLHPNCECDVLPVLTGLQMSTPS